MAVRQAGIWLGQGLARSPKLRPLVGLGVGASKHNTTEGSFGLLDGEGVSAIHIGLIVSPPYNIDRVLAMQDWLFWPYKIGYFEVRSRRTRVRNFFGWVGQLRDMSRLISSNHFW